MLDFSSLSHDKSRLLVVRFWFILAVSALGLSGLFSLAPAMLRGPFFQQYFDTQHVFDLALVLHVNLSVLVWILTISSMLWSMTYRHAFLGYIKGFFYLALIGSILMTLSPFIGNTIAVKSNYIPMLVNVPFIIGLVLFLVAILANSILYLFQSPHKNPALFGLYVAAISFIVSILCFILAGDRISSYQDLGAEEFYNLLFWGGGHILQFTYSSLMLVTWFILAYICKITFALSNRTLIRLLLLHLLFILPTPLLYFYVPDLTENMRYFTFHMQVFAGIVPSFIGIILVYSWITSRLYRGTSPSYISSSLFFSIAFFAYGGILGLFIRQMNTIVPAHYHASVVGGLTIAFMGLCYYLLPLIGYRAPKGKLLYIQPYLYSIGHLLHITGLAIMGGYGALRKTAADTGEVHNLSTLIGKIMFFSGSPLALLGGLLFIILMAYSIFNPIKAHKAQIST
jgi:heme/copper-type cytochrome/quinol oxidase subunit 1